MESFTGYLFLQGLMFDIIGARYIISGLVPIDLNKLEDVKKLYFPLELLRNKLHYLREERRVYSKTEASNLFFDEKLHDRLDEMDKQVADKTQKLEEYTLLVKTAEGILSNHHQHIQAYTKGKIGFAWLAGGFILQGIAVFTQL